MPASTPKPFTRGTLWKPERGKLYRFNNTGVTVIRPWPMPQAWCKQAQQAWRPAMPMINLWSAHDCASKAEKGAWQTVPNTVRESVLLAHFAGFQWNSLAMHARCQGADELACSVPMIASMLSLGNRFKPAPVSWLWRSVRTLLRMPDGWKRWTKICGWLGIDDSRAYVRMTRKAKLDITRRSWGRADWARINQVWLTPGGRKFLQHLPVIAHELSEFMEVLIPQVGVEGVTAHIHPDLAMELAEANQHHGGVRMAEQVVALWSRVRRERPFPRLNSLQHLELLRGDLAEEYYGTEADLVEVGQREAPGFPEPPLEGSPEIEPILGEAGLVAEGVAMKHCIGLGTWTRQAKLRLGFAYHVSVGQDVATFWLSRDRSQDLGFVLEQLQGPGNTRPSRRVVRAVNAWLAHHTRWAAHRTHGTPQPQGPPPAQLTEDWTRPIPTASALEMQQIHLAFLGDEIPF